MKSNLSLSLNQMSDTLNRSSLKSDSQICSSSNDRNDSIEEDEPSELEDLCRCRYEKPRCSKSCQSAKKFKFPDSCSKCIDRLHALLHSSIIELQAVRVENADLRELLKSKNMAIRVLRAELSREDLKGEIDPKTEHADYLNLEKENQRLFSELEITKGRLESMTLAWDDCFKRLKSENEQLRVDVMDLQKALKTCRTGSKDKGSESSKKLQNGNSVEIMLTSMQKSPEELGCDCFHALQIHRLKAKIKELKMSELNQRERADDMDISLKAYKMALEKQFSETQSFIRKLSKVLEAPRATQDGSNKFEEIGDLSACGVLTQWVEQALKSALEENGERMQRMNGDLQKSINRESSPSLSPASSCTDSTSTPKQYFKQPVNARSKSRKMSMRLKTLAKTMEVVNSSNTHKTQKVSPLETLLLMVNEIIEKLTEGRMEEYIHNERFRLSQVKYNPNDCAPVKEMTV